MKQKIWKAIKIFWVVVGILLALNFAFWYTQALSSQNLGVIIILAIFIGYSIIALMAYAAITFLIFLTKLIIKIIKWKKKTK